MRGEYVVQKRMGFFTAAVLGLAGIGITAIVCGTGIVCYGMRILDRKSNNVVELGRAALSGLPELRAALPPVLSDAIEDERRPDYVQALSVTTRLVPDNQHPELFRPIIEIKNTGKEVVSMLALHAVLAEGDGLPLAEWTEYAATPIAAGDDMRGPLMPGTTRVIRANRLSKRADRTVSCEVAEVRLWVPPSEARESGADTDGDSDADDTKPTRGAKLIERGARTYVAGAR